MPPTLLVPGSIEGVDEVPIKYIISWIKNHMFEYGYTEANMSDRILIIRAETGSGKSTIMPVELFRLLRNKDTPSNIRYRGQKVLCTQPRVLTAIELAYTVAYTRSPWNPDMILGKTVGFSTGPLKERASGLIFATADTLKAKFNSNKDDEIMDEYKFIIIDEAHERSVGSDILLFMLYKFYKRNEGNKKLPFLLLASATFDTIKYAKYYDIDIDNIIKVTGGNYNIEQHYLPRDTDNIYESIVSTIKEINKNDDIPEKADILIFAPGMKEMKEIEKKIKSDIKDYLLILKLDGEAVKKRTTDYTYVFETYKKLPKINGKLPTRRVIISTSVAETGLTINTLRYVIDMGYHKGSESYPIYNVKGLVTRPTTQSRIIQRKGRCGRLFNGDFYPMYTKETYDLLDVQQLPDIITSSEEYNVIHLTLFRLLDNKMDMNELKLLDKPSQETFIGANSIATILGFIDHNYKLTELGLIASKFSSINMEAAKIIFSGFAFNVAITDLITISAIMQTNNGNLFMKDNMYKRYMDTLKLKVNNSVPCYAHIMKSILPDYLVDNENLDNSNIDKDVYFYRYKVIICDDFIETLLAFESFVDQIVILKNNKSIIDWCQKKCLNIGGLYAIYEIRERIIDDLQNNGINVLYNADKRLIDQDINNFMPAITNIKKCLYEGLKHNLLQYDFEYKAYKSFQGLHVEINNSILSTQLQNKLKALKVLNGDIQPIYILTDHLQLSMKKSDTIMYELSANYISILDGYVYPDITMGEPNYTINNKDINVQETPDNIEKIEVYNNFNRSFNTEVYIPLCKLDISNNSVFNNILISNVVEKSCND